MPRLPSPAAAAWCCDCAVPVGLSCSSTSGILRKVDLHSPSTRCRNVRRSVDNVGARAAASATRWPLCAPELIVACDGPIHASRLVGVGYVDRGHTHFSTMDPWSPCSEGAHERATAYQRCVADSTPALCRVWLCGFVCGCVCATLDAFKPHRSDSDRGRGAGYPGSRPETPEAGVEAQRQRTDSKSVTCQ